MVRLRCVSVSCIGSNGLKRERSSADAGQQAVSVSCIGSNGLKRIFSALYEASPECFSILYRIEWVETRVSPMPTPRPSTLAVSVSCIGSNGLKRDVILNLDWALGEFQYPVSDRMG